MKRKIMALGIIFIMAIFGLLLSGCSGDDTSKTETTDEKATLPDDTGDKTLLDTTITEDEPPPAEPPDSARQ